VLSPHARAWVVRVDDLRVVELHTRFRADEARQHATDGIGVDGGLALEVAPWSPHFRDAAGIDVLAPNLARARFDLGMSIEIP
jgi:hypothetical protein